MEQVIDLKDLLKHELMDLHSAEQQIIDALPSMIDKAGNDKLKAALKDHLKVTEKQKERLEELQQSMGDSTASENNERRGLFSDLFGGEEKCKGMEGLIAEGEKLMGADMSPEASDAAIIASAQKIEHYEISAYGTASAYARRLNLNDVANKLEETLNEEYEADDLLTELAVGKVNVQAESAMGEDGDGRKGRQQQGKSNGRSNGSTTSAKGSRSSRSASRSNGNGSATRKTAAAKTPSRSSSKTSSKSASKTPSKSSSKSSSSKSSSNRPASLRKTSASNGRGTPSKSASKSKSSGSSKRAGSKRSTSKASGRGKSSRGR